MGTSCIGAWRESLYESYLRYIKDKEIRCFTNLRIRCHKLEIEIGRYIKKISTELRFCQIYKSWKVEDEIHFITECHVCTDERNMLLIISVKSVFFFAICEVTRSLYGFLLYTYN